MILSKKSTFPRGVHVKDMKALTSGVTIEKAPLPKTVYVSMAQHIGKASRPIVSAGDKVKRGQLIGEESGFISASVYSSVSGTVKEVKEISLPTGKAEYVVIESDGLDEEVLLPPIDVNSPEEIALRVQKAGLVGLGGAGFPTYVKMATRDKIDTVLINGAECEPYLTCDHRMMIGRSEEIAKGAKYIAKALNVGNVVIGVEENKPDAILSLGKIDGITVVTLKKKYPQGSEKQLIYACTGRKVAPKKLPSSVGVCVFNVQTAFQVYQAVELNVPLYERVMTVTGKGIKNPKNLVVRNGTPYSDIVEYCGGLTDDAAKIIIGGPMMGKVLPSVTGYAKKTDSGILVLGKAEVNYQAPSPCINCGRCAKACPMHLMPMYIDLYTQTGKLDRAEFYGATDCFECGACAYVCPAKRDLVGSIQLCKRKLREKQAKG